MTDSIKTTVYLDADDYRSIRALAKRQGRTAAELVREAVAQYAREQHVVTAPQSIGSGRSGRGDIASRAEELLDGLGR